MKRFLPFHIKLLLVKTLVFSHFNYCNAVINDMTLELSNRLQRSQNYCVRYLFDLQRDDHISPYYIRLSTLKQSDLRLFRITVLTHSIIRTGNPKYLADNFEFVAERSVRVSRSSSTTLRIPHHRTAAYSKSFTVTACRTWNSLPNNLKSIESRSRFVVALKRYFLDRMSAAAGAGGLL